MSLNVEHLFYPTSLIAEGKKKHKVLSFYTRYSLPIKSFYLHNKLASKIFVFIIYYTIGVAVMSTNEHWTVIESAYFLMVTVTSVGYGYYHPTDNQAKWFIIFYSILGVTLIFSFMVTFATTVVHSACDELILQFQKWRGFGIPSEKLMSRYRSVFTLMLTLIAMLVGTLVYSGLEGWSKLDGLYFTVITMTTIGYGDLVVTRESTRVFGIVFLFSSCMILTVAFHNMVKDYIANEQRGQLRRAMQNLATDKFGERWINKMLRISSSPPRQLDSSDSMKLKRSQLQSSIDSTTSLKTQTVEVSKNESDGNGLTHCQDTNINYHHNNNKDNQNFLNASQQQQQQDNNSRINSSGSSNGCSKERFVLHVLAELGVLNYQRDILPLFKKFNELDQRQVGALTLEDLQVFRKDIEALSLGAAVQGEELGYRVHNPLLEGSGINISADRSNSSSYHYNNNNNDDGRAENIHHTVG